MSIDLDTLTISQVKQIAPLVHALDGILIEKKKVIEEKRVILVVDRGWIFAGDQSSTSDGYILLKNAIHVFRWESIGFAAMVLDWKNAKVDLRKIEDVEIPLDSIIFRIPVIKDWGIK